MGFLCLVQLRLRIRRPLKISYRSLYCVVLFNGENTSNCITLTFARNCLFCINSNLSFAPCWIFQIFFGTTLLLSPWHVMTVLKNWGYQILMIQGPFSRILNPEDSGSYILKITYLWIFRIQDPESSGLRILEKGPGIMRIWYPKFFKTIITCQGHISKVVQSI